jgi:alpha-glucuronidase
VLGQEGYVIRTARIAGRSAMQATWNSLADRVDPQRHSEVAERLSIQVADAARWRDEILAYFQQFSRQPIPPAKPG